MKIRPWMQVRMPTFHFNDPTASALVAGFAAEGDEPQFDTHQFATPSPQNVAIGREVFSMLRCQQCHSVDAGRSRQSADPEYRRHAVAGAEPHALASCACATTGSPTGSAGRMR